MNADNIDIAGAADNEGHLPTGAEAPPPGNTEQWRSELNGITAKIIGCIHKVSRILGGGFLEIW